MPPADAAQRNQIGDNALIFKLSTIEEGSTATKKNSGNVKNKKKYQALKRKGMSKARAAKIANSGKKSERKGGRNSHR